MYMALVLFGVVGYMAYILMGAPADLQEEEDLKEEALKYSGINPDEFKAFAVRHEKGGGCTSRQNQGNLRNICTRLWTILKALERTTTMAFRKRFTNSLLT
jgi:hypothetical protein